ncbi:MAG TPA: type I-MYXAN CRISPR-associated protein Cas6/Cmx6 [Casimicrobiaceae bacterium]|jgi:CRISPR-associated protein Cas6|nr:type I-MYXAN CRISPR-associated protein Cas6/Cmx6 [Casimicrobiaceae bacterium]
MQAEGAVQAEAMIDVAFDVAGGSVAPGYAPALLAAIVDALPWFAATPQAGVHPLRGSGAAYGELLLARRAKLVLRVPSARATECGALEGRSLAVGERVLEVGRAEARVLRPSATLHAQRVTSATPDGSGFEAEVAAALAAIGVASPFISGGPRREQAGTRTIHGYALSVHELAAEASLRLQASGIGADRALGWGIFVPAKTITTAG